MTIKHGQKWKNCKIPLYQDYYNLVDKTLYELVEYEIYLRVANSRFKFSTCSIIPSKTLSV